MLAALRWLVFAVFALLINLPVIATLVTSFKSPREIAANPALWIASPTLENYTKVLRSDRPTEPVRPSRQLARCLADRQRPRPPPRAARRPRHRPRQPRAPTLLPLVLNLRAVPLIIFAIPIYMGFQWLGLLDTRIGLGLILTVVNLPLALVILVNALNDLPLDLDEAARMDGAANWQILVLILAPLVRPALVTAFIFGFVTAWNEFLFGLMLTTRDAVPVTVGASFFFASAGGGVQWGLAAAVMIVAALPPMLLGLVMYRQISRSLLAGAVKG